MSKPIKVLIVDDEEDILEILEYNLIKDGYEVFKACNGKEAVEVALKQEPAIILLDIMMPQVDGYQTLKWIKNNKSLVHTKVVFLTAKNKTSDMDKGFELGVDKYLTKPFSVKKIVTELTELLA